MRSRSNLLVLLGIAFFVVGGIIVFLLTDDDDGGGSGPAAAVTAIVSNTDIPAGALADELIADDRLREIEVPANQLPPGAVQSINQLQGATFVQGFAKEQPITSGGVQLQSRTFDVPEGFQAMAIQLDFVAGGAGYVNPGDHINVFTAYSDRYQLGGLPVPRAELTLSNVEVLDVSLTIPARRGTVTTDGTARASGDTVTYLLAVRTDDAEKLTYGTEFQTLYASLADEDTPPATATDGQDGENVTAGDPNVANL